MKYIREAIDTDISNMTEEMKKNLYNEYYWNFVGGDYHVDLSKDNDGWSIKYMAILNDDNETVGLVQISRKIPRSNAVLGFVVYEEFSGKGYGTRAIKEVLILCKKIGINNILINTTSKRLCQYYSKFGFRSVGCFKDRVSLPDGCLHDKYYMQLTT